MTYDVLWVASCVLAIQILVGGLLASLFLVAIFIKEWQE